MERASESWRAWLTSQVSKNPDQSNIGFYKSALSITRPSTHKFTFLSCFLSHQLTSVSNPPKNPPGTKALETKHHSSNYLSPITPPQITMTVPSTCCGRSNGSCACAAEAKCSCGKQSALKCNCEKATTENAVAGARCSCRLRAAGECTCERAQTENAKPAGSTCACGARPANACSCEKATDGGNLPSETDFTTKALGA